MSGETIRFTCSRRPVQKGVLAVVKTTTAGILALVCAWGLTACGGGGGGSSSSGDRTETQRPSDSDISVDPDGYADRQVTISGEADTDKILVLYDDAENAYRLIEEVDTAVTSSSPSISDNELTYDCDNGGQVVITVNSDDVSDDERWRFNSCDLNTPTFGRIVLNGDYFYVNEVISSGNEGFQVFDITGTVFDNGDDIVVKGVDDWKIVESGDERTETYRTDALEFIIGDDYFAIANALTTLDVDNSGVVISLASKLIGSAIDGYIDISTVEPVFVPDGDTCPIRGVIRLGGEGNTSAEIRYGEDMDVTTDPAHVAVVEINSTDTKFYESCDDLIF
ncbi:hypothetical protein ACJO5Y_13220 [Marinobacter sp. GN3S48]|uniref:hypothetical protein n=1 Tax=Marinobacter sp. GN3S48 TaxID=3382302 RepID=UPI00387B8B2A